MVNINTPFTLDSALNNWMTFLQVIFCSKKSSVRKRSFLCWYFRYLKFTILVQKLLIIVTYVHDSEEPVAGGISDGWQVTHDRWHVRGDRWHMTRKKDAWFNFFKGLKVFDFLVLVLLSAHIKRFSVEICPI